MSEAAAALGHDGSAAGPCFASAELPAQLLEACAAAAAVGEAIELGVLARVAEGAADPMTVAADCGLTQQGAAALLAALAGLDLLVLSDDGRFRPAFAGLADFAELARPWASLGLALRGERRPADASTIPGAEALYPGVVGQLASLFHESAEHAAGLLMQPGTRVLDVGAGAAPWSLALAARDAGCRVTAVELPGVIATTRRAVQRLGFEGRYQFVAGSAFHVDWGAPASFDLALVANLCHLFDPEANVHLLGRVAEALRPGGRVAIVDILPNGRGDGPRSAVLYGLGLVLRTARGRIYPYSTFRAWLDESGFGEVRRRALAGPLPLTLITARRR